MSSSLAAIVAPLTLFDVEDILMHPWAAATVGAVVALAILFGGSFLFSRLGKRVDPAAPEEIDVVAILRQIHGQPRDPRWGDVFDALFHQGSVSAESFAILPLLRDLARECAPADRWMTLSLAATIISGVPYPGVEPDREVIDALTPELERMTRESRSAGGIPEDEFIPFLMALATFRGDSFWGRELLGLMDGEFVTRCPSCDRELWVWIGKQTFVSSVDPIRPDPQVQREIVPSKVEELSETGAFLYREAVAAEKHELARALLSLFGTGVCPRCEHQFLIGQRLESAR